MLKEHIASQIYANFEFETTLGQKKIIESLSEWICGADYDSIYILNGHAGTGKTTLISAFISALGSLGTKSVLMAPTGRAAKVAAQYTGGKSFTIHKKIYRQKSLTDMDAGFSLDINRESDTCFIVDEGSMISDSSGDNSLFGSGSLLDDLVSYVRSGKRCRLLIVGDDAQLPPVGHDVSPALNPRTMERYGNVTYGTLDEVVRQAQGSGILYNATAVRSMLSETDCRIPVFNMEFPDIRSIDGNGFLEELEACYGKYGKDQTIVVTRSNKRAVRFNEAVRKHVLFAEEEIESGDMLMVVKNNYAYNTKQEDGGDFIANGDIARLKRLRRFENLYGFRFADARLEFPDYDNAEIDCKIMLDTLASSSPSLPREESVRLYHAIAEDYPEVRSKAKRYKAVLGNPHFNALQVKFAYAVTCHKAQGGQWRAVFVDRMLFGDEAMSRDLTRWLYTALTRATDKLYLVNFDERFFDRTQAKIIT